MCDCMYVCTYVCKYVCMYGSLCLCYLSICYLLLSLSLPPPSSSLSLFFFFSLSLSTTLSILLSFPLFSLSLSLSYSLSFSFPLFLSLPPLPSVFLSSTAAWYHLVSVSILNCALWFVCVPLRHDVRLHTLCAAFTRNTCCYLRDALMLFADDPSSMPSFCTRSGSGTFFSCPIHTSVVNLCLPRNIGYLSNAQYFSNHVIYVLTRGQYQNLSCAVKHYQSKRSDDNKNL